MHNGRSRLLRLCLVWLLCWGFTHSLQAQPADLRVEARSYIFDPESEIYRYEDARFEWGTIALEGQKVEFLRKENLIVAQGFVRLREGSITLIAEGLEINLDDNSGVFREVFFFDAKTEAYITAREVRRVPEGHFIGYDCTFTTCNPEQPAWEIRGSTVHYYPENYSSAISTSLRVRGVPIFYFPYLAWPTVTRRQTGLLPPEYALQTSSIEKFNLGYRLSLPYFWAIEREQDLTIRTEWVQFRGLGLGLDYQYAFSENLRGEVKFLRYFERDPRDPQTESGQLAPEDVDPNNLRPERYKLILNHNQQLDERSRLIVSGLVYSDSQFQREYEGVRNPEPNYAQSVTGSINYQYDSGSITLSASQEKVFQEIALLNWATDPTRIQRLPALSFQFSEQPFRTVDLTTSAAGSLVRYFREEGYNGTGLVVNPTLRYRRNIFQYFKGVLGLGHSISTYDVWSPSASDPSDQYTFQIWAADVEFNTTLSRIWVSENDLYSRFKHLMTPRVRYDYIEDVPQDSISGVPFGGGIATRRLLELRLDNILLAKRRQYEPSQRFTRRSFLRLQEQEFPETLLLRLQSLQDREFASRSKLQEVLESMFGEELDEENLLQILAVVESGVALLAEDQSEENLRIGESLVLARLNLIQPYDYLRVEKDYQSQGPTPKGDETEPGEPLLPLRIELSLQPGSGLALNFRNRYNHQQQRTVEYSLSVDVNVSQYSKASVAFRENESTYTTPYGQTFEAASSFSFSNTHQASDELSFGFSGTVDLNPASTAFRRRLVSDTVFLSYRPDCWTFNLRLEERVDKTTTSGGQETEYVDRTIFASVILGGVLLPEQTLPRAF